MKNIAIITARSGSKGLPDKNIKLLKGKPLLWYTIEAAIASGIYDEIMVSTDSEKYADIARQCGAQVPFLRSADNSTGSASSWDVVKEVLKKYEQTGRRFDTVTLLQPTSPLRKAKHIIEGYDMLEEKEANAVIGVVEEDHSPLWSNTLPSNGLMDGFIRPEVLNRPRQELEKYYRINGALYIIRTEVLSDISQLYNNKCYAYIMDRKNSVDIDTEVDFKMAEVLMDIF